MTILGTLAFLTRANQLNRVPRREPDRVLQIQQRRFRELLRHAVAHSPLYRDHYRGLDVERCRLEDLPPITKAQATRRFDDWVTDRRLRFSEIEAYMADPANAGRRYLGEFVLLHTSGSQGPPLTLVQTQANLDLMFMLQSTRGNATGQTGVAEALRVLRRPHRLASVTRKRGFYPTGATFDAFPAELRPLIKLRRFSYTDADLTERLNEFSPTILTAYASTLLELADAVEAGRLRLPALRHVVNNSELMSDAARERFRSVFGVPVLNHYATGECLHLANGCPTDPGAHVNADWAILEVVDRDGNPVPPGERGSKVYVTNLANRVQPIIRYEISDAIAWAAEPCRCGSRLPRIGRIEGRGHDLLWVERGGEWRKLDPFVFWEAANHCADVLDWRVEQDEPGRVLMTVAPVPGLELDLGRLRRSVAGQLEDYGYAGEVEMEYRVVPRIEPDPATGKIKRFVCRTGPSPAGTVPRGALESGRPASRAGREA